jgi:acetoin utilization deacetylase AcuC-like enzyme
MVSLHQWPLYPGTGRSEEIGIGPGRGFTVNLPLPAQSGGAIYRAAMEQVVEPVLTQFRPELVLVSAGFDAHADDPLGGMLLQDQDYGALTARLWRSMGGFGCDKLGLVLEGGYDLGALERSGHAMAQALLGERCELDEAPCPAHAQQAIDATRRALKTSWQV